MILDGLLLFTGTSNGASGGITNDAYTDLPATGTTAASNVVDLGMVLGIPSYANGGGARDLGVGDDPALKLSAICTADFTATTTIQLLLEGAPDSGTGTPGSYTTIWESTAIAAAVAIAGAQLANVDLPRVVAGNPLPRFLRLSFIVGVTTNTTGAIEANIVIDRDDQIVGITGAYSGYRAGITVAN